MGQVKDLNGFTYEAIPTAWTLRRKTAAGYEETSSARVDLETLTLLSAPALASAAQSGQDDIETDAYDTDAEAPTTPRPLVRRRNPKRARAA